MNTLFEVILSGLAGGAGALGLHWVLKAARWARRDRRAHRDDTD